MIMSDVNLKFYSDTSNHNEELKSLTRYRFNKVKEREKLRTSISRLVTILFPELEKLVPTLHISSVYALFSEFPSTSAIASAHLSRLTNLLETPSKGRYSKDIAISFRESARTSIGVQHLLLIFQKNILKASIIMQPISYATKMLVRVIYNLQKPGQLYIKAPKLFRIFLLFLSTCEDALFVMQFTMY